MQTVSPATEAAPESDTPTASSRSSGVGWLASGMGLTGLAGATFLPPAVSLPLTAVAALVCLGVLGFALSRRGAGVGHAVAGLVTALVGFLLATVFVALPEVSVALVGEDGGDAAPVPGTPPPEADIAPQPVLLQPIEVLASAVAPPSLDAAGNTVRFDAANVADGDPTTAWRTPGNGVDDFLVLTFDAPVHVDSIGVIPGYAKLDPVDGVDRFPQNRRVRSVVFGFSGGQTLPFTFVDDRLLQSVPVGIDTTQVAMQITDTTTAARDFTAVSELQVFGWNLG